MVEQSKPNGNGPSPPLRRKTVASPLRPEHHRWQIALRKPSSGVDFLRQEKSGQDIQPNICNHLGLIHPWPLGNSIQMTSLRTALPARGSIYHHLKLVEGGIDKSNLSARPPAQTKLPRCRVLRGFSPLDNVLRARFSSITALAALHVPELLQNLFLGYPVLALPAAI